MSRFKVFCIAIHNLEKNSDPGMQHFVWWCSYDAALVYIGTQQLVTVVIQHRQCPPPFVIKHVHVCTYALYIHRDTSPSLSALPY